MFVYIYLYICLYVYVYMFVRASFRIKNTKQHLVEADENQRK